MSESKRTRAPSPRRAYHHGDLAHAVRREALALIAESRGTHGLTLREIARRLGVSHSAAYRHFADKRALVTALAVEGSARLADRIERALEGAGKDLRARFLAAGWAYVSFARDDAAYFLAMFSDDVDKESTEIALGRQRSWGILLTFIAEAQGARFFGEGDLESIANAVWSMHHGLATLAILGGFKSHASLHAIVDDGHARLLDGLIRRDRSGSAHRRRG